jgi:hypothetical protein
MKSKRKTITTNQVKESLYSHEVIELLEKFDEKPYTGSGAFMKNCKSLAQQLNFFDYSGKITRKAINKFIRSLDSPTEQVPEFTPIEIPEIIPIEIPEIKQMNIPQFAPTNIPKPSIQTNVPELIKVELPEEFPERYSIATREFIEKYKPQKILDESVTNIPCIMLINDPRIMDNPDFLKQVHNQSYRETNFEVEKDEKLYKNYYLNNVTHIEKVFEQLDKILNQEKTPFKIAVDFGFIVEKKEEKDDGLIKKTVYIYSRRPPDVDETSRSIPFVVTNKYDMEVYKQYIISNISEKMELHYEDSTTRFVAITTSLFKVMKLGRTGARVKIPGYEFILKNNYVYAYDEDDNLCMFIALVIAERGRIKSNTQLKAEAKREFNKFYNNEIDTKVYQGLSPTEEQRFCDEFNVSLRYYYTEKYKEVYDLVDSIKPKNPNKDTIIMNLLRIPLPDNKFHVMLIRDVEKLTKLRVCPHCREYVFDSKNNKTNHTWFNKHIEECKKNGGKLIKEVKLYHVQRPYAPHIQKQKIYEFLFANKLERYFKPTQYYITYDFESLENPIDEKISEKTTLNAHHIPFMVSSVVKLPNEQITRNFCFADNKHFIDDWLEFVFENAAKVSQANKELYQDVIQILSGDKLDQFQKILDKRYESADIIGFNSGKFDINLILSYVVNKGYKISKLIGTISAYKMILLKDKNEDGKKYDKTLKPELRFIDIRNYIAGGSLHDFTQNFGDCRDRVKGFFPYQYVTWNNWKDLYLKDLFKQENFYSDLTKTGITDDDYKIYTESALQFENRLEYFKHYCNVDVEIMIKPIDNLIAETFEYKVDMLNNLSLSSNASMIRYALAYENFNLDFNYVSKKKSTFKLTEDYWKIKVDGYIEQDRKAKVPRCYKNNVTMKDFKYYRDMILNSVCKLCSEPFTYDNKFSLDRIDNNLGHSKNNCQLVCVYCNICKSNRDEEHAKLHILLRIFALKNDLPMTISKSDCNYENDVYHIIRKGITGGLANIQNRINFAGETTIKKIHYDENTKTLRVKDTNNVMTHYVGLDFNSLYPSVFSSNYHPFIKYTNGRMYSPGRIMNVYRCANENTKKLAMDIINRKDTLFIAEVKGHIDEKYLNEFINFLPIFRNIEITTDKETIGEYMYDYLKSNNIKTDVKEKKLTQLADTNGEFMSFSSYYLWYLIDRFHFKIDDIKTLIVFNKSKCFNKFVNDFTSNRQKAKIQGLKGKDEFCKISLNGSYGYDAMNAEKYGKAVIQNESRARCSMLSNKFKNIRRLGGNDDDPFYQVQIHDTSYKCDTCLHQAFFTLDNAKYWYLVFIYEFMYRCLEMDKIHFMYLDTDSMYLAIAGNPNDNYKQGFKHVIKDPKYYDENVFKFLPWDFYCVDEKNRPRLDTKEERIAHEKKLLGLAVEKEGTHFIALAPKCYTNWVEDGKVTLKCKGVSLKQNKHITKDSYMDILEKGDKIDGENSTLQFKNGMMSRLSITKTALTGKLTKVHVLENGVCLPLIKGVKYV